MRVFQDSVKKYSWAASAFSSSQCVSRHLRGFNLLSLQHGKVPSCKNIQYPHLILANNHVDISQEGESGKNWEKNTDIYTLTAMCKTDSQREAALQHWEFSLVLRDGQEGWDLGEEAYPGRGQIYPYG